MWDWLTKGANLQGLGTIIGGLGSIYGNIQQGKYAKDLINLQKSQYQRGIKRQDEADKNLKNAWANSSYVKDARNNGLVKL